MTKTIMIVGVGGQGTVLASRILGDVLIKSGYDVKVSEVHGMSQRGGSVVTYVRYGEKVYSPIVNEGEADILISFEICESARWLRYLKKDGILVSNNQKISPMPVITGAVEYPQNIEEKLNSLCKRAVITDALSVAEKAGNAKCVNSVLLGIVARNIADENIKMEYWYEAMKKHIKPQFLDINIKAFEG